MMVVLPFQYFQVQCESCRGQCTEKLFRQRVRAKTGQFLERYQRIYASLCAQGTSGWNLPSRYRKGGAYYNGDLTDYYHAGVVESVNPLRIRHMSSKMTTDTKLGKWNYHGKLAMLVKLAGGTTPAPVPTSGGQAYVVAQSGGTVNFRKTPSLKGALITRIPLGTIVNIVSPGEEWCKISYGNKTGYMMAQFLDIVGDGKGKY